MIIFTLTVCLAILLVNDEYRASLTITFPYHNNQMCIPQCYQRNQPVFYFSLFISPCSEFAFFLSPSIPFPFLTLHIPVIHPTFCNAFPIHSDSIQSYICLKTNIYIDFFYHLFYSFEGKGNGSPLRYSCLGNPVGRGAWWAAVHGVTQSVTTEATQHASEKELATYSSILAWRIPETEEPGGLLSMGLHRVGHG